MNNDDNEYIVEEPKYIVEEPKVDRTEEMQKIYLLLQSGIRPILRIWVPEEMYCANNLEQFLNSESSTISCAFPGIIDKKEILDLLYHCIYPQNNVSLDDDYRYEPIDPIAAEKLVETIKKKLIKTTDPMTFKKWSACVLESLNEAYSYILNVYSLGLANSSIRYNQFQELNQKPANSLTGGGNPGNNLICNSQGIVLIVTALI